MAFMIGHRILKGDHFIVHHPLNILKSFKQYIILLLLLLLLLLLIIIIIIIIITIIIIIFRMLTEENFEDLEKKGYTVVPNVVPAEDCDRAIQQYQEWHAQFKDRPWPKSFSCVINRYNAGHMAPTWEMRLKTKKVFAQLWKTEKLLSSFDAISIGRPPEDGEEKFHVQGEHWIHVDQHASRIGLHAYQGALYLEEQCEDDWTFQVMEGSHKLLNIFYEHFPEAAKESEPLGVYFLEPDDVEFYNNVGY